MSATGSVCQRVIYRGRVQGVGFRGTVAALARIHPVRGSVRNLADGSVELTGAGRSVEIQQFLDDVRTTMARDISDVTIHDAEMNEPLHGFSIRY